MAIKYNKQTINNKLYEHDVKFQFATLFGGRKHRNQVNFFSESEFGCGPQEPVGKFTYICHFKRDERNARKFFFQKNKETKKHAFILIAQKVIVALAVQARMIKSGKVSDKFDKLFDHKTLRNYKASDSL